VGRKLAGPGDFRKNGSAGRPLADRSRASGCELAETNGLGVRFEGRAGGLNVGSKRGRKRARPLKSGLDEGDESDPYCIKKDAVRGKSATPVGLAWIHVK
jgi:hypothetical protein